jgi:hypothetical protein
MPPQVKTTRPAYVEGVGTLLIAAWARKAVVLVHNGVKSRRLDVVLLFGCSNLALASLQLKRAI